ncbi:hypothetical protein [Nocardia suismassiliense]|uniref:hypothetical protein n=1 Tax=Nocardia suismassiliense TaxID=2077092 RepID=UPI00131F0FA8|nr:hypothetical protein [Nocardia suismassiliense]
METDNGLHLADIPSETETKIRRLVTPHALNDDKRTLLQMLGLIETASNVAGERTY